MKIERHVSIYPSVNLCGVVCWYFRDGALASLAFASMPMQSVSGVLQRFDPDSVVSEPYRDPAGHPATPLYLEGVRSLRYVSPKWRTVYTKIPKRLYEGRLSPFVHRAFSIGFRGLIQDGPYKMNGRLPLSELTQDWMDRYGPWRPRRG